MFGRSVAAALALSVLIPLAVVTPSWAADDDETTPLPRPKSEVCAKSLDATRARIASLEARGAVAVLIDIEGEAAETWIAEFNAVPPRTEHDGDTVLALVAVWSPKVLFALFRDGCQTLSGALRTGVYRAIEKAVAKARGEEV